MLRSCRFNSTKTVPLYLNPHAWQGLPADRVFELHDLRKKVLADKYNPNDAERAAILSTVTALKSSKPSLDYAYEIDHFKERHMNNTPSNLRGLPPKLSNIPVIDKGATPHEQRRNEQLHQVSAYEMPLLAKFRQPYQPKPVAEQPLKITYHTNFSDNALEAYNRKVRLLVKVADLGLSDAQLNKFKVLAGNKYNHSTDTFRLSSSKFAHATQNAKWLVDTFNGFLDEVKHGEDTFTDVPVDTRHMRPLRQRAAFPDEWKRPEDAPTKPHLIVRKLVEQVKSNKDEQYVANYLP